MLNPNECLNGLIWQRCPKEVYVRKKTIELWVTAAICQFNDDNSHVCNVLTRLGCNPGKHCMTGLQKKYIKGMKRVLWGNWHEVKGSEEAFALCAQGPSSNVQKESCALIFFWYTAIHAVLDNKHIITGKLSARWKCIMKLFLFNVYENATYF